MDDSNAKRCFRFFTYIFYIYELGEQTYKLYFTLKIHMNGKPEAAEAVL